MAKSIYKDINVVDYYEFPDKVVAKTDKLLEDGRPLCIYIPNDENHASRKSLNKLIEDGEVTVKPYSDYEFQWLEGRISREEGYNSKNHFEIFFDKVEELGGDTDENLLAALREVYSHIKSIKSKFPKT
jgi:hypothetical protein